jgi:lactate dehydrogenase-like 2-hydroxyacid dehydrogenase
MTAGDRPRMEIVTPTPLPDAVISALREHFELHRLDQASDRDALIAAVAPRIRAIASAAGILSNEARFIVDGDFMSRFPRLEIVANLGVGYENVDAAWAGQRGIVVTNTPDVLTDEVADLAMGLLLATIRELPQADRYLREGRWRERPYRLTSTLRGRTLGILGLGRIGTAIAVRAQSFGLHIGYHGRRRQAHVPYDYFPTVRELAGASDILMVVAPGGPETRHLVDRAALQALGPEGVLVNVARGSLVDEAALIAALREGSIQAAGLDVFADEPNVPAELISMDNVVLLPHVGSGSRQTRAAMGRLLVDNLVSWAVGKGPLSPVPETPWTRGKRA